MKKTTIALLMAFTVILSGIAGYGGAYLASDFASISSTAFEDTAPLKQSDSIKIENLYDMLDAPSFDISLLTSISETSTSQPLTIPQIATLASSSVVEIYTESVANSGRMGQFVTEGAGSGVIISRDGYVATNNHVIEGSRKITVRLNSGTDYEAELIGRDSKTDLAVLKINAAGLQPVVYGDSDKLVTGELAVAIGNPLGKLGGTVSEGIISALSRNIEIDGHMMTLLQTTAAVNPGNSGGGLFNAYGELIGIVNAKSSGSDIEGIGFAIPVNLAKSIIEALIEHGYVPGRIDFGVTLIDVLNPMTAMMYRLQTLGVYVAQADSGSALMSGDRIFSINGKIIGSIADINELLDGHNVGDVLSVVVLRNGISVTVEHMLKQAIS